MSKSYDIERTSQGLDIHEADAEITRLTAEVERLRAELEKHETRFNHCSEMIERSFNISGTLRAEYARKAHHYALEARAAIDAALFAWPEMYEFKSRNGQCLSLPLPQKGDA